MDTVGKNVEGTCRSLKQSIGLGFCYRLELNKWLLRPFLAYMAGSSCNHAASLSLISLASRPGVPGIA